MKHPEHINDNMSNQHSDNEDTASFEDSSYELLSDSIISNYDDDDDDSSLASIDLPNDDVASLGDEDNDSMQTPSEDEDEDEDETEESAEEEGRTTVVNSTVSVAASSIPELSMPTYDGLDDDVLNDSTITVLSADTLSTTQVKVEEPANGQGEGLGCLLHLAEKEVETLNKKYRRIPRPKTMSALLSMKLHKNPLSVKRPLHVLFVGDESGKDEIIKQLGAALMVDAKPELDGEKASRFNVVPISSFGDNNDYPEVELVETFGVEMAVDVCTSITHEPKAKEKLTMTLQSGERVISHPGIVHSQKWTLPELVIIYARELDDDSTRQTIENARELVARHGFGHIVVTDRFTPMDTKMTEQSSIKVVITEHANHQTLDDVDVFESWFIDLHTFLRLDLHQLNRSINYMLENNKKTVFVDHHNITPKSPSIWEICKQIWAEMPEAHISRDKEEPRAPESLFSILLFILAALGAMLFTFNVIKEGASAEKFNFYKLSPFPPVTTISVSTTTHSVKSVSTVTQVVTSTVSATMPVTAMPLSVSVASVSSEIVAAVREIMQPGKKKSSANQRASISSTSTTSSRKKTKYETLSFESNESEDFKFYPIGGSHVIIKPPLRYVSMKKPPQLLLNISRHDQKIKGKLSKVFAGVYSLAIDEKQAFGPLNISIYTKSKPILNSTHEIDLGSSWTKLFRRQSSHASTQSKQTRCKRDQFAKVAKDATKVAKDASDKVKQHIQSSYKKSSTEAKQRVKVTKQKLNNLKVTTRKETRHAQKLANERIRHGVKMAQRFSRDAKLLYSFASEQARAGLEQRIHKAQKQAAHKWGKMQRMRNKRLR